MRINDLTGQRFGRLVVVCALDKRKDNRVVWSCRCDCGNLYESTGSLLTKGATNSCGCLQRELSSDRNTTHGMSESQEYVSWRGMRKRCYQTTHPAYDRYGGRGIQVHPEWNESFEAFYRDMGPAPSPAHTLDRKDNDGNYEPRNCRWADKNVQQHNRRVGSNSQSGVRGVTPTKDGQWRASLTYRGISRLDRCFPRFEDAVAARAAAEELVEKLIQEGE